jgi:hypothetical protein
MKWYITRKRLLVVATILGFIAVCLAFQGCTKREEQNAKDTGGAISRALGLPPFVGESIVTLGFSIATYLKGHQRGRKKERSCAVPKASP